MTTTVTVHRNGADRLRKGDRITAIDGVAPGREHIIAATPQPGQRDHLDLVNPYRTSVEWRLYLTNVTEITVERAGRAPQRRTIDGLVLQSAGPGRWVTLDGQHDILLDHAGLTICEGPHVVRQGRGGYQCPGGAEHETGREWCPGSQNTSVDSAAHDWFPTMREAAQHLASVLAKRGLLDAANTPA